MGQMEPSASIELPPLLNWISAKLKVQVRAVPPTGLAGVRAYLVDLSRFRLRLSEDTPCLDISSELCGSLGTPQLRRLIRDVISTHGWQRLNVLVLVPGDASDLRLLWKNEFQRPLIFDQAAQAHILAGPANSNLLIEIISQQAPVAALSPYEVSAPVTGERFFGRESDLRHLMNNTTTNFLVTGNRRMGKTSLIIEAQRRMRHESEGYFCVYLDCQKLIRAVVGFLNFVMHFHCPCVYSLCGHQYRPHTNL